MKILSWNINGLRAIVKKGFLDFLESEAPDILCLQEIKIDDNARNKETFDFKNYQEFWNSAERPGYSGTLTLIKDKIEVKEIINFPQDDEGRVQIFDLGKFYLVNIYFPNANHQLSRLDFKIKFNNRLLRFLKKSKKPLIIAGDFNVAHQEIDLARPKDNQGNAGFTKEERNWMTKFLKNDFIDTFRNKYPKKIQYSWWTYRALARERNIGWRIDYICISKKLKSKIKRAYILDQIMGSDHCPIGIEIK